MGSEEVLRPELLWIGNRCYRKISLQQTVLTTPDTEDLYPEYQKPYEEQHNIPIKHHNNNFYNTILAPACLRSELNYKKRNLEKSLKMERVEITVPQCSAPSESVEITIKGPTKRGVYEASRIIYEVIETQRFKSDATHFISIPVNSENIQKSFLQFKDSVLRNCKDSQGLHKSIFQDPLKLHITIITLVLWNSHDRENAVATLQNCREDIMAMLYDEPPTVMIRGIEIMNDDPEEVDVLYAKVELDDGNCVQRMSDLLIERFMAANLNQRIEAKVKFHVTLMNTLFREKRIEGLGNRKRETFDSTQIFEKFSDYEFGSTKISQVHVSARYTTAEDGFYIPTSSITLDGKKTVKS